MALRLNQIEHKQIRPKFVEPRIHFALVCAASGRQELPNGTYQAARIEEQLQDQTRYLHSHDRWFRFQEGAKEVRLPKLCDRYGSEFEQVAGSGLGLAARYTIGPKSVIEKDKKPRVRWPDYGWILNDKRNEPKLQTRGMRRAG